MKKVLTIIFDGFGMRDEEKGNAIKAADMPNFHYLWNEFPHALLGASESSVGLAEGQAGNSEVGHMTIGAGCLLKQNEVLVDEFLANPDMENPAIIKLMELKDKTIHLMGLCSDGNVHAGVDDFLAMYQFLVDNGFKDIVFHLITDGRDTPVDSAYKYIKMIEDAIAKNGIGTIATVCGRYYAMDRDQNWERTQSYYDLIVNGKGGKSLNIADTLQKSYSSGVTDEFVKPVMLAKKMIKDGDTLLWMNYRADRAKQILSTIVNSSSFTEFLVQDLSNVN
ncbi:MAG: 2,3-bisphosphoglycerate-independent phosphoglycerate mutase, partial [Bacilli bacterium]|nr:2,3-bisphosphoglycerate-independent phosphoglycerate mutase [Bacilli bacterium]